jgi:hypothetical protein
MADVTGDDAMPIRPYLKDSSFDPDQITAMSAALEEACRMLEANPRPGLMTDVVASKIIELAQGGERDPTKLSARALAEI